MKKRLWSNHCSPSNAPQKKYSLLSPLYHLKFSGFLTFFIFVYIQSVCAFIKSKVDTFHILFWTVLVKLKRRTVFHSDFGRHLFPIWKSMLKSSFGVLSAIETSCQRMSRCLIFLHNTRWLTDPTPVLGLSSGWDPVSNGSYDFFLWLFKSAMNKKHMWH